MTSVLTSNSAMIAMQTLRSINAQLDVVNNRVSTGQRISSATDGAAYWSIASTIKADNGSLTALKAAMRLDKNSLDVAAKGTEAVAQQISIMKEALVAAQSDQADRNMLQIKIAAAQNAIRAFSNSASINQSNWLSVRSDSNEFSANMRLPTGFSRKDGSISVQYNDLDVSQFILFDNRKGWDAGPGYSWVADVGLLTPPAGTMGAALAKIGSESSIYSSDIVVAVDPTRLIYNVGGATVRPNYDRGYIDTNYTIVDYQTPLHDHYEFSIDNFDISKSSKIFNRPSSPAVCSAIMRVLDKTQDQLINNALNMRTQARFLEAQQEYAQQLMDINNSAIGSLVDANIEEESTKLKALQTQQQLGIQSLSISNAGPQNILNLFQ